MKNHLVEALKRVITSDLTDMQLQDLAYCIEQWTSSPNPVTFAGIVEVAEDLGNQYKNYPYEVYRGQILEQNQLEDLSKGKRITISSGSWSLDENEAKRFAEGGRDTHIGVVYQYVPKKGEVVLNLVDVVEDDNLNTHIQQSTKDSVMDEAEILLEELKVSKKNIYSSHIVIHLDPYRTTSGESSRIEKKLPQWEKKHGDLELNTYGNDDVLYIESPSATDLYGLLQEILDELDSIAQ